MAQPSGKEGVFISSSVCNPPIAGLMVCPSAALQTAARQCCVGGRCNSPTTPRQPGHGGIGKFVAFNAMRKRQRIGPMQPSLDALGATNSRECAELL